MNDFTETIKQLTNGESSKVSAVGLVSGRDGLVGTAMPFP